MKFVFVKKKLEARDTYSFYFKPESKFIYEPGKFVYLILPELKNDPRGNMRHFSISSSPTENGDIMIVMRFPKLHSQYKDYLLNLKSDDLVDIDGPQGVYDWNEKTQGNHVFIAGGVGIASFRGRIKYSLETNHKVSIHLLYSNKTEEDVAFYEEIKNLEKNYENFKVDFFLTESKSKRIDKDVLMNIKDKYNETTFWISGTPNMVDDIEEKLIDLKVPYKNILSEKYTGYK